MRLLCGTSVRYPLLYSLFLFIFFCSDFLLPVGIQKEIYVVILCCILLLMLPQAYSVQSVV